MDHRSGWDNITRSIDSLTNLEVENMKISQIIIGTIVFSLVVTFFSLTFVNTGIKYGMSGDSFSERYSKIQNISASVDTVESRTFIASGGGTSTDTSETNIIGRVFNGLMIVPNSIAITHTLLVNVAEEFGVHPIFVQAIYLIVIVSVIFLIWSAIMKWEL